MSNQVAGARNFATIPTNGSPMIGNAVVDANQGWDSTTGALTAATTGLYLARASANVSETGGASSILVNGFIEKGSGGNVGRGP